MKKIILIFLILYPLTLWANIDDDLIEAARQGNQKEVEYLLKNGADVNYVNSYGSTALIATSAWGHVEIVKILISKKAELDHEDKLSGGTALMYANMKGYKDVAKILKSAGAGKNDNLIRASKNGDIERVKYLFTSLEEDVNAKDIYGCTALIGSIHSGNTELVQLLLKNGADPNLVVESKINPPLITAAILGNIEIVKLLLLSGASVNVINMNGGTSLYYSSSYGDIKIVKLLLENGADPNIIAYNGETALGTNSSVDVNRNNYKAIKKLLKKYGARK